MKKIGIVTIIGNNNYGNRLQNYAVQEVLKEINCKPITLKNDYYTNQSDKYYLRLLKHMFERKYSKDKKRKECFEKFNNYIDFSKGKITAKGDKENCDYYVVGSDQVWNPFQGRMKEVDLLSMIDQNKRIAFSASFSVNDIPDDKKEFLSNELRKFKAISVREGQGKKIIDDLNIDKNVEVLLDPTFLLDKEKWHKVSKKPDCEVPKKYILNYFLGELSENRKKEIERIAELNNCKIINILDKNDKFYSTGPSEFLYLEENAFLICTDSFHSSVFAIIFDKPFIIFDRQQKNVEKMNSRIDTLIDKLELKNRKYNEKEITKENLEHNYINAYEIIGQEKKKSINFLKSALNI